MATGEDSLFIKQAEILQIIRDHKIISSNSLRRRFMGIQSRTFRYHIKKLVDMGLVRKRGATNGVFYEALDL